MADKIINVKIKEAYDTEANQNAKNPVLLKGQMAISSDKRKAKIGDGTSTQQNLSYMNAESANSASTATKATQDASGNVITSTYATKTDLGNKADKSHTHTKDQVGLGNVDNTADANKTVAAANKIANMEKGTADVDRIVWFADTAGKDKPAWDDDFKYNPAKNTLTVPNIKSNLYGNVSGNVYSKNVTGTLQSKVIMLPDVPYDLIEPTHTTEKYLKELLKQICSNYPDEGGTAVFIGTANPNSRGPVEIHIYQTSDVNSDGYPRYASGQYQSLNRDLVLFGFHNFDQYYGCPEQAKNAENANTAKSISTVSNRPASANLNYGDGKLRYFIATSSMSTGKPTFNGTAHDAQIIDLPWDNTGGFDSQVAVSNVTGQLSVRSQQDGKWQPWHSVYDEGHKPSKSDVGLSKVDNTSDADKPISKATQTALDKKVDKVTGKGLSTNDFTTAYKNKLDGIESGAQKNTVTGVKGNSESNYRTGNINLTADNVGALSKSGGTLTGQLKINGAAADKPLMVRGIVGSDGNGTEGELYLNYGVDASIKIGKEGKTYFDSSGIFHGSVTGSVSGNASTATTLQTSRSINGTSFNGSANITTANQGTARNITITDNSGAHSGTTTSVNGSQAYTLKMPATISASFIGSLDGNAKTATSATRASQDGNGENIASTYVKKTDLSSSMTVSAMGKDNFLLTADGCLYTSTRTETGFLMITIPHPYKNTGIKFKVSIYTNGDNTPTEYWISGKSSTSFNQVNCGAYSVGKYRNAFSNLPVVFSTDNVYKTLLPVKLIENSKYVANDDGALLVGETIGTKYGTKCFVSIGRADTKWVSPTIVISDIMLNDAVSDFNSWKAGQTMAFTTTQKTGIEATVNNPNILQDGHASLDLPLSGGTMSGSISVPYDNNFISHENEFNFQPKLTKNEEVYINYRTQSSNDYKVTKFHFRDGSNAHAYTDVQAKNFIGNLSGTQNSIVDDHGTENPNDTQIPVYNGNKIQHRVSQNIRMSLSGTTLTITA